MIGHWDLRTIFRPRQTDIELDYILVQHHAMPLKWNLFLKRRRSAHLYETDNIMYIPQCGGECIQAVWASNRSSRTSLRESTSATVIARRLRWIDSNIDHCRVRQRSVCLSRSYDSQCSTLTVCLLTWTRPISICLHSGKCLGDAPEQRFDIVSNLCAGLHEYSA